MLILVWDNIFFNGMLKHNYLPNFFLKVAATIDVPTKVADQYSHRFPITWDIKAGAKERAGFMDAPQIGPANIASNNTTEPIAIPANIPCSLLPEAT